LIEFLAFTAYHERIQREAVICHFYQRGEYQITFCKEMGAAPGSLAEDAISTQALRRTRASHKHQFRNHRVA